MTGSPAKFRKFSFRCIFINGAIFIIGMKAKARKATVDWHDPPFPVRHVVAVISTAFITPHSRSCGRCRNFRRVAVVGDAANATDLSDLFTKACHPTPGIAAKRCISA